MEQLACGEIGLRIKYFYSLTPRQFYNIVEGHAQKNDKEYRLRWEHTRFIAFYAAYNFESKDKNLNPQKFFPFPWETKKQKRPDRPKRSIEEIKAAFKEYDKQIEKVKATPE